MQDVEISKFIHEYCDAFRPGNTSKIAKYFHFPVTMIVSGINMQFASVEELVNMLGATLTDLASKGFSYSKIQTLYIHRLADDIAIVSASYKRFKSDDTVLEEVAATYTLREDPESGWGIVVIIGHDLDKVIGKH